MVTINRALQDYPTTNSVIQPTREGDFASPKHGNLGCLFANGYVRESDSQVPGGAMKTVYVGNLSYSTTDDTLRSTFSAYGTVEEVNVMTDRQTGQPRGFAFVNMQDDESAEKAIAALDGSEMDGRRLTVSLARPKSPQGERRPFGAGAGRGGNRAGGGGFKRGGGGGGGYGRY